MEAKGLYSRDIRKMREALERIADGVQEHNRNMINLINALGESQKTIDKVIYCPKDTTQPPRVLVGTAGAVEVVKW